MFNTDSFNGVLGSVGTYLAPLDLHDLLLFMYIIKCKYIMSLDQ